MQTIELIDLIIGYDNHTVVSPITASLYSGQLTCLLGANGSGKSTLLRTLAGFQPPLKGTIKMAGKPLHQWNHQELAQKISVVLTEKLDLKNITVYELVGLGRSPYTGFWGRLSKTDDEIIQSSIALVGITPLSHRKIQTLSDGEKQKVFIAKALAQQTSVIILDEPTAFLDFQSKAETLQLLARLAHKENKCIFLSIHDIELAIQVADKIWLIDDAHQLQVGTPKELIDNGIFPHFIENSSIQFDSYHQKIRIKK